MKKTLCKICGKPVKATESQSCPVEMNFEECHFDCAMRLPSKEDNEDEEDDE